MAGNAKKLSNHPSTRHREVGLPSIYGIEIHSGERTIIVRSASGESGPNGPYPFIDIEDPLSLKGFCLSSEADFDRFFKAMDGLYQKLGPREYQISTATDVRVEEAEEEAEKTFVDPNLWGSDVGDLVEILNRIDIPEEFRESLQKEINSIAEGQSAAMERDWGPDA